MNAETITHTTLKELVDAGAIRRACAVAFGDRWGLVFSYGGVEKTLRSKNGHNVRNWANLNSVANYLAELGIRKFEADATNYDLNQKTLTRPDKSAALKRAGQDARRSSGHWPRRSNAWDAGAGINRYAIYFSLPGAGQAGRDPSGASWRAAVAAREKR